MNSWRSSELLACAPPFTTFSIGTGRRVPRGRRSSGRAGHRPPRRPPWRPRGRPRGSRWRPAAPCCRCRRDHERRVDGGLILGVEAPDRRCDLADDVLDRLRDALAEPGRRSPSRSSTASNFPVEAPEGTAALPAAPDSSSTSTSTVGLPRESRIVRARTSWMGSAELLLRGVEVSVFLVERERGELPALRSRRAPTPARPGRRSAGPSHAAPARGRRSAAAQR